MKPTRPRTRIEHLPLLRALLAIAVVAGAVINTASISNAAELAIERPNILLITADNLGYGDIGCYGNKTVRTPHLDRLSASGVRCTDFYTASPTCTVSRACLLTGRYAQRHKLTAQLPGLAGNYGVGLRHSEILLPELLQQAGYRTACFGKWNIGFAEGSRPTERGFDEFLGHASGNIDYYSHVYNGKLDMHRGVEPVRLKGYSTDLFADAAIRFMRPADERPFFVYLPFNAPHFPNALNKAPGQPTLWQAPASAFAAYGYDAQTNDEKQRYYAVITALDDAIGRVLASLDTSGKAANTLVMFYSDNGAFMLKRRGLEVASNRPLRDGGVTLWEGGIRVPAMVRWPGRLPAGTECRAPLLSCDFFSLSLRAAGAAPPADRVIDGHDPLAALAGEAASPHEALFFQYGRFSAVRAGRMKLLRVKPTAAWMLYDVVDDIGESHNLAAARPQQVRQLEKQFQLWLSSTKKSGK